MFRRNMKTIVISHLDLDGYGCNIVAQRYMGRDIEIHNVNYDELATTLCLLPRDVQLIVTDLSIPENLKGLLEEFSQVIVIDHHKSTLWAKEWASGRTDIEVQVSEDRCATWWFYEYLARAYGYKDESMDEWVKFIDDYDRYIHAYPESRRLNSLLYISNRDWFVSQAMLYTPQQVLDYNREKIDRYLEQQKEYISKTTIFQLNAHPNVMLMFAEKNKSAIAETLIKECDADLVYGIDMHNMTVSLRSSEKSKIDCSQIAKMIHPEGGGHPNASGASLDTSRWLISDMMTGKAEFKMVLDNLPIEDLPTYEED